MNYVLYNKTRKIFIWITDLYNIIKNETLNLPEVPNYKKKIWLKAVFKYYTDLVNFPEEGQKIKEEFLAMVSYDSCISHENLKQIFKSYKNRMSNSRISIYCSMKEIDNNMYVQISDISMNLPSSIAKILLNKADITSFYNLVVRYYILGPSDGLFLSIDKRIYQSLYETSGLAVLECYASPFNYNLPNYCSVFNEDMIYGSKGPFIEYLKKLNVPCRLIINPPYTKLMMKQCFTEVINYMNRQRGEFIAMVPVINNYQPLEMFLKYPNTAHGVVEGNKYTIHNYAKDIPISAPMPLYIVANISMNFFKSSMLVNDIINCLNMYAS